MSGAANLPQTFPRQRLFTLRRILGTILAIGAGLLLYYSPSTNEAWATVHNNITQWQEEVRRNLLVAALLFILIYVCLLTPPIPLAAITALCGGALFGQWIGFVVLSIGAILSFSLSFWATRYLFHDWVEQQYGHKLKRWQERFQRDGAMFIIALRLVPVAPYFMINMGLALTKVTYYKYAIVSWLSMAPLTFLYARAGTHIAHMQSPKDALSLSVILTFSLLGLAPLLLRWGFRYWRKTKDFEYA